MTITPFLSLKLRGRRDAVLARQRARRVASLLSFDCHEQTCIAAATFVVACQAIIRFKRARLCFQIENQQLQIFVEEVKLEGDSSAPAHRLAGLFSESDQPLFRVEKQLPAEQNTADEIELGWLVKQVEATAGEGVFAELVKQNQEILALLHELRLCRADAGQKGEKSANPHAA